MKLVVSIYYHTELSKNKSHHSIIDTLQLSLKKENHIAKTLLFSLKSCLVLIYYEISFHTLDHCNEKDYEPNK